MVDRVSTHSPVGARQVEATPSGVAKTDGHDQSFVDLVRALDVAFGIALPGGGSLSEYQPSHSQVQGVVQDAGRPLTVGRSGRSF